MVFVTDKQEHKLTPGFENLAEPEVRELQMASVVQQQVVRLNVTVDDAVPGRKITHEHKLAVCLKHMPVIL